MIRSMTAFASRTCHDHGVSRLWELRSVNGRGLDLRLRLPEGVEGLEPGVRAALAARIVRGSVSLTLRISRDAAAGGLALDEAVLDRTLAAIAAIEERAQTFGVALIHASAAEVLAAHGVIRAEPASDEDNARLLAILTADLDALIDDFLVMRRREGEALGAVLADQLDQIERLTAAAREAAAARRDEARAAMAAALARVVENAAGVDEGRVAAELALIAVKQDITEEIDRLTAHVAAARALLADPAPAGRKLDFLAQEFNREANTLCSKAQSTALTAIGLELKAVIDQMREQIQNVE